MLVVGSYDEIEIGGITWQTKALGKTLKVHKVGDAVEVQRASLTKEEYEEAYTRAYDELPRRYAVAVYAHEYVVVEDGRIVGLASPEEYSELLEAKAIFDSYGRDEYDELSAAMGAESQRPPRTMHVRQELRTGKRPRRYTAES